MNFKEEEKRNETNQSKTKTSPQRGIFLTRQFVPKFPFGDNAKSSKFTEA